MDFEYRYSEHQQRFRDEVARWLDGVLIEGESEPAPGSPAARTLRRKLGEARWLVPTCPAEFGGAGLAPELETPLVDELNSRGLAHVLDRRPSDLFAALDRWGTIAQKQRWLPDVAAGASVATPLLAASPDLDPNEITLEASSHDGRWILEGSQRCDCAELTADYAWLLAKDGRSNPGLVMLLVPMPWPGASARPEPSASIGPIAVLDFDGASIPSSYVIGEPGEGWAIALETMLSLERVQSPRGSNALVNELLGWARGVDEGPGPVDDQLLQEHLVDAYFDSEIERILRARLWWTEQAGVDTTYLAAQHSMWAKRAEAKLAKAAPEVFGPHALTSPKFEALQRQALTTHVFRERAAIAAGLGLPEASSAEPEAEHSAPPAEALAHAATS